MAMIKIMHRLILISFSLYLFSLHTVQAEVVKKNQASQAMLLPNKLIKKISKMCSDCKIVTLYDLEQEAKEEFIDLYSKTGPGWVYGDFNGDGKKDYALLLTRKEKERVYQRLVVLLSLKNSDFKLESVVKEFEGYGMWYIDLISKGTLLKHTKAFEPEEGSSKEVILKNPGIAFYKAGSSMSVFYFDKGTIRVIPVSY